MKEIYVNRQGHETHEKDPLTAFTISLCPSGYFLVYAEDGTPAASEELDTLKDAKLYAGIVACLLKYPVGE